VVLPAAGVAEARKLVPECARTASVASSCQERRGRSSGQGGSVRAGAPRLVSVSTPTRADKDRLVALGLDMTEHGGSDALGVVLHGAPEIGGIVSYPYDVTLERR